MLGIWRKAQLVLRSPDLKGCQKGVQVVVTKCLICEPYPRSAQENEKCLKQKRFSLKTFQVKRALEKFEQIYYPNSNFPWKSLQLEAFLKVLLQIAWKFSRNFVEKQKISTLKQTKINFNFIRKFKENIRRTNVCKTKRLFLFSLLSDFLVIDKNLARGKHGTRNTKKEGKFQIIIFLMDVFFVTHFSAWLFM